MVYPIAQTLAVIMIWSSSANAEATAKMKDNKAAHSSMVSGMVISSERDVVI